MTPSKVRLVPGNHEFVVEGEETLLEAALRAGMSVNYGCSNGNCGDCRARVVAGEVRRIRPHDHVFTDVEKQQGYTLMCSVTAASDLVLETGVADGPEQIPLQQITTTVRGMDRPNSRVLILRVQTPRTRRLRFLAGQSVRASAGGESHVSTIPLANCPCDDRNLVFHLVFDPGDPFVTYCFEQLRNGETVEIEGPQGEFVLLEETPPPLLFIAFDSGFAPVRSLVENVLAQESSAAIDLIWVASDTTGHYQDNLCRSWQDAMDNFRYQAVHWNAEAGVETLKPLLLEALNNIAGLTERRCFIAGSREFVQAVRTVTTGAGIPDNHHRSQRLPLPP